VFASKPYSFGFTLKELCAQTCDDKWHYQFYDRTKDDNKDKPIFKLLSIEKFAFYWQSDEQSLASEECSNSEDMHSFMEVLFPMDSSHIDGYNYIIEPSKFFVCNFISMTQRKTKADVKAYRDGGCKS
jgi:hypothetical protein